MDNATSLNLSALPKELRLILFILKPEADLSALQHQKELITNLDWDHFLRLAFYHGVFPLLYLKLKKLENNWLPQSVLEALHRAYRNNTMKMLYLTYELEQICKLFGEQNLRLLQLKGPVLAVELYGNISLRKSVDLDILVDINDLERVEQLLKANGYLKEEFFTTVLDDWKWRIHHMNFVHPKTKIKLEIHWRLHPGPGKEPSFDDLWERRQVSSLTSYSAYYFDLEDLFLHLVTHGARHGWSRLAWIIDIDKILKQKLDLVKLKSLLKKYQCLHIGGQALILVAQLLNTPLKEEMLALEVGTKSTKLAQDALFYLKQMVDLHADDVPEEISNFHKRHLFALMSKRQKIVFIMSMLYPYPEDAETLPLPKRLHFLYVPLRPVLWTWRKMKRF